MRVQERRKTSAARAHLPCPEDRIFSLERRTVRLILGAFVVVLACSVVEIVRGWLS